MTRMPVVVLTLVVLFLAALCQSARAQLRLDAGDSWTHEFTSLPAVVTGPGTAERLSGFHFAMSDYEPGADLLRIEMFENTVTDSEPLCSALLDTDSPWDSCAAAGGWDDFQGTVRLTMLSGSALIESVVIYRQVPMGVDGWTRYESRVIPVPEAGSCGWLAAGTVLALWRPRATGGTRRRRRSCSRPARAPRMRRRIHRPTSNPQQPVTPSAWHIMRPGAGTVTDG